MSASLLRYFDLHDHGSEQTPYYYLNNLLRARIDLHMETGDHPLDERANVYLAGLLFALISSGNFLAQKPHISPCDADIRHWLDTHPGASHQFVVYKDNADFALISLGVFFGIWHRGSYHRTMCADTDSSGRIALYYEMAASALNHIQGGGAEVGRVFSQIATYIGDVIALLQKVSQDYLGFSEHLSEGSFYHLEREVEQIGHQRRYGQLLDEFLRLYGAFQEHPDPRDRLRLLELVAQLKELNADFSFDERKINGIQIRP
jgi:hypothetical protein